MTPSNPTNQQPFIYRIADALGITHLVVAVQHSHLMSEITGLVDALAAKANAQHHHASIYETKGVQTAIVSTVQDPTESNTTYIQLGFQDDREEEFYQYARISLLNLNNLKRALINPDTTPTADSDNLVTSGGVKAALDGKAAALHIHTSIQDEAGTQSASVNASGDTVSIEVQNDEVGGECEIKPSNIGNLIRALSDPDSTPTANSTNLVTSGGVKVALEGKANLVDVAYKEFTKSDPTETIDLDEEFDDGHQVSHFVLTNLTGNAQKIYEFFVTSYGSIIDNGENIPYEAIAIAKVVNYDDGSTKRYILVAEGIYEA